jgi:hypothetical protein
MPSESDSVCKGALDEAQRSHARFPRRGAWCRVPFQQFLAAAPIREAALLLTYRDQGITMTALAAELGFSVTRVSRVSRARGVTKCGPRCAESSLIGKASNPP